MQEKEKIKRKKTPPQHNIATSALCSKRPQQITRTSHVAKRVTVHALAGIRPGKIYLDFVCFLFFIFKRLYDIGEEQRHCCDSVSSVFATYDTVNNLHYKAHS